MYAVNIYITSESFLLSCWYYNDDYGCVRVVALVLKNPPEEMRETEDIQVWSLGWKDPLEKEMAAHCSIPAWRILWTEEAGGLQSTGL